MSNIRRLYRIRSQRKLGGVCAGLARYFNIDVSIIRIVWILLAVLYGSGILAYILAWIIIPEEP
ncbi:MAG: PspC domain-containing protein [Firmicutes bacterium]|jgi:phage shock protein C|nr:PspC domain-containing protein [Bacillota bacterium]